MDAEERELFTKAVSDAAAQAGDELDAALEAIGWDDALAADTEIAVATLFEAQGATLARSSALEHLSDDATRRLAIAHELIGASRAMLELARTHALEREQFGRPIAAFQAVRHRLAEALVAVEAAQAAVDAAWLDQSDLAAQMAKAIAGRAAKTVAKHSQQVLAGIGFTSEHPFHRYYWRVLELDLVLGDATAFTRSLGERIVRDRAVPPKLPL
jgi:hypothetical protein